MSRKKNKLEISTVPKGELVTERPKQFAKKDFSEVVGYITKELANGKTPKGEPIFADVLELMERFDLRPGYKVRLVNGKPHIAAKLNRTLVRRLQRDYGISIKYGFNPTTKKEYVHFSTE